MAIGSDYSVPVTVNGYSCKNCTDVANAKKHIDPEHPRSGPYGITAKDDPTVHASQTVTFGGALSGLNAAAKGDAQTGATTDAGHASSSLGQALDISV